MKDKEIRWVPRAEAAERAGVSTRTLKRRADDGLVRQERDLVSGRVRYLLSDLRREFPEGNWDMKD